MAETNGNQQRQWPRYYYLLVPLVAILLTLAMIELLLALFWPVPPSMSMNIYYKADPVTGFAHEPSAVGRYPTGILAIANSQGFRDNVVTVQKPPGTQRILVLGDSFTVGVNVEMEESYPQVLERMMNESSDTPVEIINAAVGGSDPFQYAQYFEHHGSKYSPDEVMVGFFVGNDTYSTTTSVEQIATVVNGQRVSRKAAEGSFVQLRIMLHQNFNLVRLLQGFSFIEVSATRQDCEDFSHNLLNIARNRLRNHRVDLSSQPKFSANAVNQIQRIKQKADRMGIPLTVLLIPDELQINKKLREGLVPPNELHIYDFAMPQQLLAEEFAALGIATLDLLPFYVQDERCLYMNDSHWTPQGHAVAASAIAQYVSDPARKPSSVPGTAIHPGAVSTGAQQVTLGEAVTIIHSYVDVLRARGEKKSSIFDSSLLPFPKDRIKAAAIVLNLAATDPAEKESFIGIAKSLALYQPDVGDNPIPLEGERSEGTSWRSVVEPEMQNTERAFAETQR